MISKEEIAAKIPDLAERENAAVLLRALVDAEIAVGEAPDDQLEAARAKRDAAGMAASITPEEMIPETVPDLTTGAGRNVMVFDEVRTFAYRETRLIKREGGSIEILRGRLLAKAAAINCQFPRPLPQNEVGHIIKSVTRWAWREITLEAFSAIQSTRARMRWEGHESADLKQPWRDDGISRRTWYRRKARAALAQRSAGGAR